MTEEWTDGDLMAFLQKEAQTEYGILRNHLLGNEVFHEICNFGFQSLSPLDRYSAAIISSDPSNLPRISDAFNKWFKDKQFFIDAYIASPPEPSVTIGTDPPRLLVDTPLSKAALEASLKEIHVAVYSLKDIADGDIDMSKLLERYSKELDNTLDEEKAKSLMETWWDNNKKEFCVHKLTELILNSETMNLRNSQDFTSDLILVTAFAIYQSFAEVFKTIVFVQSLSEIVKILHDLKQENFFKKCDGSDMKIYNIVPREDKSGYLLPPQFLVDIEMLETFGLMYRIIKVAKFGEHFQQMYQMRISGWGRAYFQRNLSSVQDLQSLYNRLKEHFTKVLKDHEQKYAELFEKVKDEPTSREVAQEAKKLTKDLPLKVI